MSNTNSLSTCCCMFALLVTQNVLVHMTEKVSKEFLQNEVLGEVCVLEGSSSGPSCCGEVFGLVLLGTFRAK